MVGGGSACKCDSQCENKERNRCTMSCFWKRQLLYVRFIVLIGSDDLNSDLNLVMTIFLETS